VEEEEMGEGARKGSIGRDSCFSKERRGGDVIKR